jgi:hypothetical protein
MPVPKANKVKKPFPRIFV